MKRLIALVLALVLCLALVPAASAAENLTQQQMAVLETAYAYYMHNPHVQYDSNPITVMGKYTELLGDIRGTDYTSPEMAVETDIMYSVCSMYCFEVYYDAFGYEIMGSPIECKTNNINHVDVNDPKVVFRWVRGESDMTRQEAARKMAEVLQPGDVINGGSPSGHAMLYVGDILGDGTKYILHCAGQKYDLDTGKDMVEAKGAIRLDKLDPYVIDETKGLVNTGDYTMLTVLRPLNEINRNPSQYPMTASAKARLQYPRLFIDRQADYNKYTAVPQGGDITVTILLKNNSAVDYTVPVTEIVPANATLKAGSITGGGSASGNNIKWSVELKAGQEKTLTYTVTATAKRGETIRLEGGNVGGIKSNSIPVIVSGKQLTADQQSLLAGISRKSGLFAGQKYTDTAFAEAVYKNLLGIEIDIPSSSDILSKLYTRERLPGATTFMYLPTGEVPADFANQAMMQIPFYFGGKQIRTSGSGGRDRILDFKEHQLQAGDVILCRNTGKNMVCYVYLGNGKVAYMADGVLKTENVNIMVENLSYDYFVGLRPTQAYDDINTNVALPFTDVKQADWYYSFVKELYTTGVVAGQTATTFNPGGNLTYGAALKLLVVGLTGNDPGNASGAHWATNYLNVAKTNGWTDIDASKLDTPITREAFCEIAAKAGNLTETAENKFTDTNNPAVLALVKAGVINGMSETTFAPNNILTRAQISKIISLLLKL